MCVQCFQGVWKSLVMYVGHSDIYIRELLYFALCDENQSFKVFLCKKLWDIAHMLSLVLSVSSLVIKLYSIGWLHHNDVSCEFLEIFSGGMSAPSPSPQLLRFLSEFIISVTARPIIVFYMLPSPLTCDVGLLTFGCEHVGLRWL